MVTLNEIDFSLYSTRCSPAVTGAMSLDQSDSTTIEDSESSMNLVDQSKRMDLLSLKFVTLELRETAEDDLNNDFMDQEIVDETIEEILHTTDSILEKSSIKNDRKRNRRKINLDTKNSIVNSNEGDLDIISLDELAWHDSSEDCWVAIYDYVYDCTEFVGSHPGGHDVLLEYAGRDATLAFIGTGHSIGARNILEKYLIGELPINERIFRKNGGVKIVEQ